RAGRGRRRPAAADGGGADRPAGRGARPARRGDGEPERHAERARELRRTMADDGVELLRRYLEALVRRAEHHLLPFPDTTGHVIVELILRHDRGSLACRVPPPGSEQPIELGFTMDGHAYALAYTHAGGGRLELCFFQAEDGIRFRNVTGVQTCALPI